MTPSVRQLAWIVARDVNRTVGGGMASMELLRRSFGSRRWVDEATHGLFVAVSRLTPGTNILAYCAAAGWRLRGWRGTLAALAAASVPASLVIFGLAATLVRLDRYAVVRVALSAGMFLAAALVLSSAWNLLKPYLRMNRWRFTLTVSVVACVLYALDLTPVRILLICAMLGALMPARRSEPAAESAGGAPGTVRT
jgi:chromate transporter